MELNIKQVTYLTLTLVTLMTLTSASTESFSIGDVSAELQGWGTVSLERTNDTVDLDYTRVTFKVSEVSVLDSSATVLASYPFKMERQEFKIAKEMEKSFEGLKVGGRRLTSGPLGDLPGNVEILVYLFTSEGTIDSISEDYDQKVKIDDAFVVFNIGDVTKCKACTNPAYVDLQIEVSGKAELPTKIITQSKSSGTLEIIHFPSSSGVFVGNKATIDGTRQEVAEGFPEVEGGSDKTSIIVRIPAFSSSASYGMFVRQDRRTPEQAKKEGGTLGAILDSNSGGTHKLNLIAILTWAISLCYCLFYRS